MNMTHYIARVWKYIRDNSVEFESVSTCHWCKHPSCPNYPRHSLHRDGSTHPRHGLLENPYGERVWVDRLASNPTQVDVSLGGRHVALPPNEARGMADALIKQADAINKETP